MEPGGSMTHSQGLSNNPYPEPNQSNSSYDAYFPNIHSNIVLLSRARPPFFFSFYKIRIPPEYFDNYETRNFNQQLTKKYCNINANVFLYTKAEHVYYIIQ